MDWISALIDAKCPFCSENMASASGACAGCARELAVLCGKPPILTTIRGLRVAAAFEYEGWIRDLILRQKLSCSPAASRWLARELLSRVPMEWRGVPIAWVPGRPLAPRHLVEAVAAELARLGHPLVPTPRLRRRLGIHRPQKNLSERERALETPERRYAAPLSLRGIRRPNNGVLLLDDVATTGGTLLGCRILLETQKQATVIGAVTLAFTPRYDSAYCNTLRP